jgi:hypothetical protein
MLHIYGAGVHNIMERKIHYIKMWGIYLWFIADTVSISSCDSRMTGSLVNNEL